MPNPTPQPGRPPFGAGLFQGVADAARNVVAGGGPGEVKTAHWLLDGKYGVLDPAYIYAQCVAQEIDTSRWQPSSNAVMWPSGPTAGRVRLLVDQDTLCRMGTEGPSLNELHTLKIGVDQEVICFKNLVVSRPPVCVVAGARHDPAAIYLIEFSDLRHLLHNSTFSNCVNVQYNVIAADTGTPYDTYDDTKNGAANWLWQEVLDNLWSLLNVPEEMGDSPQLPFTPETAPRNLKFIGVSGWLAYNDVLDKLGCTFVLNPDSTTEIVLQGEDDSDYTSAIAFYDENARMDDDWSHEIVRGKVAAKVCVYFHKQWKHYGSEPTTDWAAGVQPATSPAHEVTIDCPDDIADLVQPDSSVAIWDDAVALIDYDGSVINESELDEAAGVRADNYYRQTYTGGNWVRRVYMGFVCDPRLWPGSQVSLIVWYDRGHGPLTEVFNAATKRRFDAKSMDRLMEGRDIYQQENWMPPDLARRSYANYPLTDQLVRNVSATKIGDFYDGWLVRINPETLEKEDMHRVWIYDPNED